MKLLPQTDIQNLNEIQINQMPTKTYNLNFYKKQFLGSTDNIDAMKQAVYLILNTERYQYLIYDWDYGVELADLIGREKSYVIPETERRITDALMYDKRIINVEHFSFETERGKITAFFKVNTIFGDFETQRQVTI